MISVDLVDPAAFTPPYDHALAAALARAGASVRLVTSDFAYGPVPDAQGYEVLREFYRHARGPAGSRLRSALKLAEHGPDMLRYRHAARATEIVHFQWLAVPSLDARLLPRRPLVLTAHDLLPREPRPGQVRAQRRLLRAMDALVVHSEYGRRCLVDGLGLDPGAIHVIPHGAFEHLTRMPSERPLPEPLEDVRDPVVLCFGLIRPYKGIDVLIEAWREISGGELWIVGRPRMDIAALRERAPASVRWLTRFVADDELPAFFRRADIVVLPYAQTERFDQSGVLATALAFGKPVVLTDIGGFGEIAARGAAQIVPPGDPSALAGALSSLLDDPGARERLGAAALATARGELSWDAVARRTLELYETIRRA